MLHCASRRGHMTASMKSAFLVITTEQYRELQGRRCGLCGGSDGSCLELTVITTRWATRLRTDCNKEALRGQHYLEISVTTVITASETVRSGSIKAAENETKASNCFTRVPWLSLRVLHLHQKPGTFSCAFLHAFLVPYSICFLPPYPSSAPVFNA